MAVFGTMNVPQNTPIAIDFPQGTCLNIKSDTTTLMALDESCFNTSQIGFNPSLAAGALIQIRGNVPARIWFYTPDGAGATIEYFLT